MHRGSWSFSKWRSQRLIHSGAANFHDREWAKLWLAQSLKTSLEKMWVDWEEHLVNHSKSQQVSKPFTNHVGFQRSFKYWSHIGPEPKDFDETKAKRVAWTNAKLGKWSLEVRIPSKSHIKLPINRHNWNTDFAIHNQQNMLVTFRKVFAIEPR